MSTAGDTLQPINFTYAYQGHGWAQASISNGPDIHDMFPSYVAGDPLFLLVQALVGILRNASEDTGCEWFYEPAVDRWCLHRQGETLHITIRGRRHGYPRSDTSSPAWFWSAPNAGEIQFTTRCDLWAFATQVREAVRQLRPKGENDLTNPRWVRQTAETRALRGYLDEHERAEEPSPQRSPQ